MNETVSKIKIFRSIGSAIVGNMIIRGSSEGTAIMLGLYLSYINLNITPISAIEIGFIGTGYRLIEFICDPVMGAWSDQKGRKFFMVVGPLLNLAVVLIYSFVSSFWLIFFLLFFEGLGAAMRSPVSLSYLSDATSHSEKVRGRTMSFYQLSILGSLVIGYALGGRLWDLMGIQGFRFLALVYAVGILIMLFGIKEFRSHSSEPFKFVTKFRQITNNRDVLRLLPGWTALSAVLGAWMSQSIFQMAGQVGGQGQALVGRFSGTEIGLLMAGFAIIFAGGTVFTGYLIGRMTKTRLMMISIFGAYICCLSLFILNHLPFRNDVSGERILPILLVLLAIGIFAQSGFAPTALAYVSDISEKYPNDRGTIIGTYYVFLSIGQMVGAWIGGFFAHLLQIDGIILLTVVLVSIGFVNLLFLNKSNRRKEMLYVPESE